MAEAMTRERQATREAIESAMKGVGKMAEGEPTQAIAEFQERLPSPIYLYAAGASILGSAILFLRKNREAGIFVGLWAPTIMNLALFYKLLRPSKGH
jgi:hypothetical protein